jgi:aldehyde dehydrogenase (NAD+)
VHTILKSLGLSDVNASSCVAGEWLRDESAGILQSLNPANGQALAAIVPGTPAEYERMGDAAVTAFATWRHVPAPKRGEAVRQIADDLRLQKEALATLIALETGKIRSEALGEVQEMIDIADFAVGQSRMLYGKTMPSERPHHRLYEQWLPLGVVGVITAFNFPVAVWAWNAFIAAIAGDTVIWKPSPKACLCAVAVQNICNRTLSRLGYPGVFSLFIPADAGSVDRFVEDSRIALVSFTGSSAVGRKVAMKVAGRFGRILLELSGNNALIVDQGADLNLAIPAILFGAVGTAGQRCTTTRRLLVHESTYEPLVTRLIDAYRRQTIGDPLDPKVSMGPLIDAGAVERFQQAMDAIKRDGGKILYGGGRLERAGYFVEPTLVRAENHWSLVQRETFAPILYTMPFKSLDEAIALQNAVPQGLSSALFTRDLCHAEQFLSAAGSDCGIANINIGTSGAEIGGAFGGEKETGGGREAGSDAWKAYMRRQTNTINWGTDLPLAQGIEYPGQR